MTAAVNHGGSASIAEPDYWWYRARASCSRPRSGGYVGDAVRVLDVGSADGPSVGWLHGVGSTIALDIDPRGLEPGGVCGSALALPFARAAASTWSRAFDVLEHCEPEAVALAELARVLAPGGRLLMSVPAYEWAWSDFDDDNGHHRRYTRPRPVAARRGAAGSGRAGDATRSPRCFPFFAAERLARRVREPGRRHDPGCARRRADAARRSRPSSTRLLMRLCRCSTGRCSRRRDLPFGSSVLVAADEAAVRG